MRKIILSLCGLASFCVASAQFSVGVNGNYSKYANDASSGTPGFGVRFGYSADRVGGFLSYTNGFAITDQSTTTVYNTTTNTPKTVGMEGKLTFKTISLMGTRVLIGDEETTGKFYIGFGASYVMAKYSQSLKETLGSEYQQPELFNESESGLTLNALIGGEYKLGRPALFGEVGFAYPANTVNNVYVENVVPSHLVFNLGVKFTLGGDN